MFGQWEKIGGINAEKIPELMGTKEMSGNMDTTVQSSLLSNTWPVVLLTNADYW